MKNFRNSYLWLFFMTATSILAGVFLIVSPEQMPLILIQVIGVVWILEGLGYAGKLAIKHIESRIKSKTGRHGQH